MKHRHLQVPPNTPIEQQPVAALVDLLQRGDLEAWRPIAAAIARAPHGAFAARVLRLLDAYPAYGTSALWRAWIDRRRARAEGAPPPAAPPTLRQLRRAMQLTQVELARRLGMSQSDLSKLERRRDVRLSSLWAYARALGGQLRVVLSLRDGPVEVRVGDPTARRRRTRQGR